MQFCPECVFTKSIDLYFNPVLLHLQLLQLAVDWQEVNVRSTASEQKRYLMSLSYVYI